MKSYSIQDKFRIVYWFLKEPDDILYSYASRNIFIFKDGERCKHAVWRNYLHREDGPAVEYPNGGKYWYWHGEWVEDINSQEEFEIWKRFKNFQ